ncbi:hypothetical protein BDD26_2805 [Xenorhabdus cabanillasii]|uniref:Acyl transferase family protein n=1 Tax=Xenorhabdus cabanillasii TaxID=351673 RepID=A0A3D9UPQ0_9GAMM|nr:hypothetical protein BDD26_2805 [Xenorhabdus cabanillasii]
MKTCTVAMFPGQGAQFQGMGRSLFDKYEYHMRLTQQVLGYSLAQVWKVKPAFLTELNSHSPLCLSLTFFII